MANEKRLIDANAIPYYDDVTRYYSGEGYRTKQVAYREDIDEMSTVDAVEVVHGRWVKKTADYVYYYACSECGEPVLKSRWGNDFFSGYCPNCGAKMDGDGNG